MIIIIIRIIIIIIIINNDSCGRARWRRGDRQHAGPCGVAAAVALCQSWGIGIGRGWWRMVADGGGWWRHVALGVGLSGRRGVAAACGQCCPRYLQSLLVCHPKYPQKAFDGRMKSPCHPQCPQKAFDGRMKSPTCDAEPSLPHLKGPNHSNKTRRKEPAFGDGRGLNPSRTRSWVQKEGYWTQTAEKMRRRSSQATRGLQRVERFLH